MSTQPERPDLAYMQEVSDCLDEKRNNTAPQEHSNNPNVDLSFEHCFTDGLSGFDDEPSKQ